VNYGSIRYAQGHWLIQCEPHIRAHLKRVFARVDKGARACAQLTDTPENSRNLLWFIDRYPMTVDRLDHLRQRAAEHIDMEQRIADLLSAHRPPAQFELAVPPREYQRFAASMVEIRRGLLLGDDVGLGKSVSAICPMARPTNLPAVVVCPAHMPTQWAAYLARFAPQLKVHIVRKGQPYPLIRQPKQRQRDLWPERLPDVIIISYHKLRGWAETLGEIARYAVFDECQQLRHDGTSIYRAAKYLADRVDLRMGLSATPIYNFGSEFFPVVNAIVPDALGSYDEFIREWCQAGAYGEKARLADAETFGAYLRREGIMLRRTRADVGRELPPLTKIVHEVESDPEALKAITGDAVALARIILERNERFRGEMMQASGRFESIMRQATGIAKAPYVAEFVRILVESGQRVVLFGWHRQVYRIWAEKLADLNPVFYTGEESAAQKDAARTAFVNGDSRVLIMSLRSGAGVDGLQYACSTVVFGELDWSPGVHEQCIGRVARDGQENPAMAYFLTATDGADPIMVDVLGVKREQIEGVRNPGQGLVERVDTGEDALRRLAADFLHGLGIAAPGSTTNVTALPLAPREPITEETTP
jgi:SNF2 family DNA or RNA helicase